MKKALLILTVIISIFGCISAYSAESAANGNYKLIVNGKTAELSDLPTEIYEQNGTVMVPLRKIGEALGYKVEWDCETGNITVDDEYIQKAVLQNGTDKVVFVGTLKVINMSRETENALPTVIYGGHTYVPLDFFREFFNDVSFDGETITVEPQMCYLD